MQISGIEKEALKLILHASKSSHPEEFGGILRADGGRITEVLIIPGTFSSERSVLMKLNMLPVSSDACGSVHSHTSNSLNPSRADLNLFGKLGEIHIIVTKPYNEGSWKAFDSRGRQTNLEVVETETKERVSERFYEDFKI